MGLSSHVPLIAHAATSTTHPHAYHELFENHVLPFWQQNPPRHRLSKKPYKSIWDRNAVLREDSLTFQVHPLHTLRGASVGFSTRLIKSVVPRTKESMPPNMTGELIPWSTDWREHGL